MVFELCAANSSHLHSHSPGGAAVRRRVLAEVQLENMFSSSAVKLCLRRSRLVSLRYSRCTVSVIIVALSHTHTRLMALCPVSYTHLTLPTTPYV